MFIQLATKSRGAVVIAGIAGSIGLGAFLAPTASAQPIDHRCDRYVQRINFYAEVARGYNARGDYEGVQNAMDNQAAAAEAARFAGCLAED
jgi:hypothetical protein